MIPVVLISDENFIMQTHIVIKSLIANKSPETKYDVYVVMAECSEEKKKELNVLESSDVKINFIETSLEEFRDIKQLAHIPIACLLKFKICDLVSNYDKLIYLDGDIVVRGDLQKMYDIEVADNYAMAVSSIENSNNGENRINAGIMLFNAKKMRDDDMAKKLIEVRKSLGDKGSMDQQTFNLVISDKMGKLPCIYNCIPYKLIGGEKKNYDISKLNALYGTSYKTSKEMVEDAVIIHYATGGKPWKYTYIPCSEEWFKYYRASIYKDIKLKRLTRFTAHCEGFVRVLKKGGIVLIFKRIGQYIKKDNSTLNNWG